MSQLRLIEVLAYELYCATLVGHQPPAISELFRRMNSPQVGDLVLETSSILARDRDGYRLGKLIRVNYELVMSREEWVASGESELDQIPRHRVWTLELPNGEEVDWENATFIAVPTERIPHLHFAFESDPKALTGETL